MKIGVAGNQWITQYLIEYLQTNGTPVSLIVNVGDDWTDRISGYTDLLPLAEREGIELYRPEKYSLKSEADEAFMAAAGLDLLIVFGWQRLIPPAVVASIPNIYGVHGGPEKPPRCRGRAVFNWSLLMGLERFYMYLFKIDVGVDDGDLLYLEEFEIRPTDDICTLYHKNCVVSSRMFGQLAADMRDGKPLRLQAQDEGDPTYLPKRTPADGEIRWQDSARDIENLIRAVTRPYPGAYGYLAGAQVLVWQGHVFDEKIVYPDAVPGEIVDVFPNGHFVVKTGEGTLYVRDYEGTRDLLKGKNFENREISVRPFPLI